MRRTREEIVLDVPYIDNLPKSMKELVLGFIHQNLNRIPWALDLYEINRLWEINNANAKKGEQKP